MMVWEILHLRSRRVHEQIEKEDAMHACCFASAWANTERKGGTNCTNGKVADFTCQITPSSVYNRNENEGKEHKCSRENLNLHGRQRQRKFESRRAHLKSGYLSHFTVHKGSALDEVSQSSLPRTKHHGRSAFLKSTRGSSDEAVVVEAQYCGLN